jgi:hypothetical protein
LTIPVAYFPDNFPSDESETVAYGFAVSLPFGFSGNAEPGVADTGAAARHHFAAIICANLTGTKCRVNDSHSFG